MSDVYQQVDPGGEQGEGIWRNFFVDVTLRADALTCIMLCMVTFISSLVAMFSIGYMKGDRGYWRFFAYIGLFVFSMTMLVSVSNFLLLFVFWEAVGVCSYLLIGFWYEKPAAAAAGKKAFLVNRVGDLGFMLGVFLIWTTYGTLNFHDAPLPQHTREVAIPAGIPLDAVDGVLGVNRIENNAYQTGGVALAICLLLLLGACGKSAQFPLHIWLPDAMEGPTPVSALIHAATMVTAGVYMIARCTPLFTASPEAQLTVASIGAFTALLAGLIALTQFDLKRVLAYSTISQLGYMFLGLGTGTLAGISGGMFHLFTHAFFKALLFLGAGSVMHAMGNVIDMRRFGGLRRLMPITFATFLIGCLALSGIVPLSGFWSKDAVVASVHSKAHDLEHELEQRQQALALPAAAAVQTASWNAADEAVHDQGSGRSLSDAQLARGATIYKMLYYSALFTAFLTAFYTFRALYLTFFGPELVPHEAGHHAHESPWVMWVPLVILATFAAGIGLLLDLSYLNGSHPFADFLARTPSLMGAVAATERLGEFHIDVAAVSTAMALAGVLLASVLYGGNRRRVAQLQSIMDFRALTEFADVETVARLQTQPWIKSIDEAAGKIGLRWLVRLVGNLALMVVLAISAPLLLGRFLSPYRLSYGKFFFDQIYNALIVTPLRWLATLLDIIDQWLVDGLVNFIGRIPPAIGSLMRSMQTGMVQFYALAMVLGGLVMLVVINQQLDGHLMEFVRGLFGMAGLVTGPR